MPNKFLASWELVRAALKALGDIDGGAPYNSGWVQAAMIPGSGSSRDNDRTQITQVELGIAFDNAISAAPSLGIGLVSALGSALASSLPTISTMHGDGLPPLYLARPYPPGNSGLSLITAIGGAVDVAIGVILSTFLGVPPPNPALATGVIYPAWQSAGAAFVGKSNILDASVVRFIAGAYQGGEGSPSDLPAPSGVPVGIFPELSFVVLGFRTVRFTNITVDNPSDPGLAWCLKFGDNEAGIIGGPGSTLDHEYPGTPGPISYNATMVVGNKAGTTEGGDTTVFFAV